MFKNISSKVPPLQLRMHPICSASNPGPQSLKGPTFTNLVPEQLSCLTIKLPKVWGQHPMHHVQRRGGRRVGQEAITCGSVIIGHLQEAPRVSDHQTPACRSTQTKCILPRNWDSPVQSNDKCAFTTISDNF